MNEEDTFTSRYMSEIYEGEGERSTTSSKNFDFENGITWTG